MYNGFRIFCWNYWSLRYMDWSKYFRETLQFCLKGYKKLESLPPSCVELVPETWIQYVLMFPQFRKFWSFEVDWEVNWILPLVFFFFFGFGWFYLLSHVQTFATSWTVAGQAPLPMEFSRQGYWTGLPLPSPWYLPNPGIKPGSSPL